MNLGLLGVFGWGTAILAAASGCSSAASDAAAAGASGASGASVAGTSQSGGGAANVGGSNSGATNGGTESGGAVATDSDCSPHPTPLRSQGSTFSFAITPTLRGKLFEFGQANPLAD